MPRDSSPLVTEPVRGTPAGAGSTSIGSSVSDEVTPYLPSLPPDSFTWTPLSTNLASSTADCFDMTPRFCSVYLSLP